jgi:hypothetical protein
VKTVTDAHRLEVGDLQRQLAKLQLTSASELSRLVNRLKDIRNALARISHRACAGAILARARASGALQLRKIAIHLRNVYIAVALRLLAAPRNAEAALRLRVPEHSFAQPTSTLMM